MMNLATPREPLQCTCAGCKAPYAYVQGDTLIITSRHHGEAHVNTINLKELFERMKATGVRVDSVPMDFFGGVTP